MRNKQEKIADTLNVNSDIPPSIIVHGPQGCGKTRNALKLAAAFGLKRILDNYQGTVKDVPKQNALILTNTRYESDEIEVMTFHDAMKQTGLIRTL